MLPWNRNACRSTTSLESFGRGRRRNRWRDRTRPGCAAWRRPQRHQSRRRVPRREDCGTPPFEDTAGKMNLSVADVGGAVLAVSQFTLYGDVRRGKRPSFDEAARPECARELYEYTVKKIRDAGLLCQTGEFQAMMKVSLVNDGLVTILRDSERSEARRVGYA